MSPSTKGEVMASPQADAFHALVRAAHHGVDVRLDVFPEMQHVFQSALGMLPESDDAIRRIGNYLGEHLGISS